MTRERSDTERAAGIAPRANGRPAVRGARVVPSLVLAFAVSASCTPAPAPGPTSGETASVVDETVLTGQTMGTTFTVRTVPALPPDRAQALRASLVDVLARIDALVSTWRDDSQLEQFNRAPAGRAIELAPETIGMLRLAGQVHERSDGALDVTVGPLVDAWGFGAAGVPDALPTDEDVARLRGDVGWRRLTIDAAAGTAAKDTHGLRVDLSAIAKGHAVDALASEIEGHGVRRYLVELGGEVRARGERPGGGPWRVAVERPDATGRVSEHVVALRDRALATSGDYRRAYEVDGRRVTHAIDPRSGRPVEHAGASVTVLHESCAVADAWATALLVLGPGEGLRVARSEGLAALFLVRDPEGAFTTRPTPAWEAAVGASGP